jgi:outer membrane protein TolC
MIALKQNRSPHGVLMGILFLIPLFWVSAPTVSAQEAPTISLDSLIREAMERNPEIEAARQNWKAAKEEIPQSLSLEDPQLSLTQWAIPSNLNIGDAGETWYGIEQSFPFPGKRTLRGQVSAKAADAAEQEYLAKVREVVASVKSAFYQLFWVHQAIALHLEHQALLEEFVQVALQKYAVGQAPQQDSLKAQVELSKLHNSLLSLEQEKVTAQARINTLLNRSPEFPVAKPEEISYRPFPFTLEDLRQRALKERPELKAALLTLEKSEKARVLAKKNDLPDVTMEISFWDVHAGPDRWMAAGKINLPWIFRAKYDARIQQAAAEEAKTRADYQTVRNGTLFGIQDLFVKVKTAEQQILVYQTGVLPQAEQSLGSARIGYEAGRVDFLNLIDSERTLKDFQLEYFTAMVQFEQGVAELERAVGTPLTF